jgi:Hemerythrin HHE cation binding domain
MTTPIARTAGSGETDLVAVLLRQHARIRELFDEIRGCKGDHKRQVFDELRALLAIHEIGEEVVLRPVTRRAAGPQIADARTREEGTVARVLAELETVDVDDPQFDVGLADLEQAVSRHTEAEEAQEFPPLQAAYNAQELQALGERLVTVEQATPGHPRPTDGSAPVVTESAVPFAAMLKRARHVYDA